MLGATEQLIVGDRALIEGDVSSTGTLSTIVRNDVVLPGDVYTLPQLNVGDRSTLEGLVYTDGGVTMGNSTLVTDSLQPPGTPVPLRLDVTVPDASAGSFTVRPDGAADWTDARYDRITVFSRASLTITAGTWFVDHLTLEPQAELILDDSAGPIRLVVGQSLTLRGDLIDATDDGEAPNLIVAYDGTRNITLERPFSGSMIAPFASLALGGNQVVHEGAFFARRIEVRPGVAVLHLPQQINPEPTRALCPEGQVALPVIGIPGPNAQFRGVECPPLSIEGLSDLGLLFKPCLNAFICVPDDL